MFIRYFVELPLSFEEAEERLLRAPGEWVPGLAQAAEAKGEQLLTEVGFGPPGRRIGKQVLIELGTPVTFPSKTVLPMSWRPIGAEGLFPELEADVEVASLGASRSQLSISARYQPPWGAIGRAIDRALLHRVAEATLKDFLDRVGEAMRSLLASSLPR
jgi:hypothetical protein